MNRIIYLLTLMLLTTSVHSQNVGIGTNTPHNSAMLEVQSTNKGVLVPRLSSAQRTGITGTATGLLVFDTDTESFWFKGTSGWLELNDDIEDTLEDADGDTKIQVEKSMDEDTIRFDIAGTEHFKMNPGGRLEVLNTANSVFIGMGAGQNDDLIGDQSNIAIGLNALKLNVFGTRNIAIGSESMTNLNNSGGLNIGIGDRSLRSLSSGASNVAIGANTGFSNNTGDRNIFIGNYSGNDTNGSYNVMIGDNAGSSNEGSGNIFLGRRAGQIATGDNKLYIENSNSNSPLIYGEFDNDLVRINGTLNLNNAFSFPTADGTANQVLKTNGTGSLTWQEDLDTDTDDQTLSLTGSNLSISEGNTIDISVIDTDTDDQTLLLTGTNLSISEGNSIDIGTIDTDTDDQTLSLTGSNLSISEGNTIDIGVIDTDTDDQTLLLTGTNLSISEGNSIDIGTIDTDTDDQTLSLTGSTLSITEGNSVNLGTLPASIIIEDADMDTKIQVEENEDEDLIKFDIAGTEHFKMSVGGRLEVLNSGNSVFLGEGAGQNDDLTGNNNVYIGTNAGAANTTGNANVAVGNGALSNNTGTDNVAVGSGALLSSTTGIGNVSLGWLSGRLNQAGNGNIFIGRKTGEGSALHNKSGNVMIGDFAGQLNEGSDNVFLGKSAGKNESGSNKLYIENSNSTSPLIYGEFDNDLLRINGTLNVNNAFSFPSTDGSANQVLKTDGSGNVTWEEDIDTDTDNQTLGLTSDILSISNGNSVDLSGYAFSANNGLNLDGVSNTIQLGGALVENTTINNSTYGLNINLNDTGDFNIQDNGTTITQFSDDGVLNHGDDMYWKDGSSSGTDLMSLTDDGNDGRLRIFENGLTSVDLDANSQFVFNEQGLDRDFRVESTVSENAFKIDALTGVIEVDQKIQAYDAGGLELASDEGTTRLHIQNNGKVKIGADGDAILSIIKYSVDYNIPLVNSNDVHYHNFFVDGATTSATAMVSTSDDLPGSMFIGQVIIPSAGLVRVKFLNEGSNNQDPSNMTFYITVINH